MPWLWTTIAGSMPIAVASCSAAPSAFGPGGTGRVNETWTMPSPVVSPYGRTTVPEVPFRSLSDTGHLRGEQLQGRVVRVGSQRDDAVEAPAAVRGPPGDAERAVGDGLEKPVGMGGDPLEQVDRLAQ